MTSRPARLAAAVALALTATACAAGTQAGPAATSPGPQTAQASTPPPAPCPDLPRTRPVEGGLPPLTLPCLGRGPDVRLSDLRGTPTVVNVWAAWCTNCDREMPLFAEAVRQYGDAVRFFGVHYKAPREAGLVSQDDFGVPFPSVHDEDGDRVVEQLGAYAPPQTFFVDASGRVTGRQVGEIRSQHEMTALIQKYLGVRA